jgi:hypothetical protein
LTRKGGFGAMTAFIVKQIVEQGNSFSIKCKNKELLDTVIEMLQNTDELKKIMKATEMKYIEEIRYSEDKYSNCLHVEIVTEKK